MDRLGHADSSSGDVQCVCTHCRQDSENDEKRRRHWDAALEVIRVMRDCLYDNQQDQYFDEEKRLKDLLMSSCLNNNDRMLLFQSIQMMLWGACEFLPETDRMLLRESSPLIDDVYSGNIRLMFDMAHESARWVFSVRGGTMSDELHRWLARINGYIMQHLSEDLSLTTLAEQFDYHPVYLSRLYKHASGIGLMEYITDIRLKRAFILLQSSGKSVAAIAGELGFSTSNYFSRWFRKKTGQSPQEYREAYSG